MLLPESDSREAADSGFRSRRRSDAGPRSESARYPVAIPRRHQVAALTDCLGSGGF